MPPLAGPINASLKLARDLQARGHSVYYLSVPDCEPLVRAREFPFIPIFAEWFPKGFALSIQRAVASKRLKKYAALRKQAAAYKKFLATLINGTNREFQNLAQSIRPDLFIISPSTYYSAIWALLAYDCGVRCIYLNDTLGRAADSLTPPITTALIPRNTLLSKLRIILAWLRIFWLRAFFSRLLTLGGLSVDWFQTIARLAERYGYPAKAIDTTDLVAPKLLLPELILCPREFDFPTIAKPGRYYIEASIDVQRPEVPFPWERLDNRPLGYCALGTLPCLKQKEYLSFFQTVIEASNIRPDWQWVLSVGPILSEGDFPSPPPNVILVKRAPQLALLRRAALMITHAGINSVKECISFGVPMIVFPLAFDGPGTAARVVFHGLGLRGDWRRNSAHQLQTLIDRVDKDPYFRAQAKLMREVFRLREEEEVGLKILDAILR
jgi:UDP:flavonoid glycosyltransferase YjiC (YdhE family)